MNQLLAFLATVIFLCTINFSLQAQQSFADFSNETVEIIVETDEDLTEKVFFTDTEHSLFFIDFEAIGEMPLELTIKQDNAIVLQEDVADLPANTIFEINLSILQLDKPYVLEIKTELGILTKDFKLLVVSKN